MFMFKYGAVYDHDNLFLTTRDNFSNVKCYKRVTDWIEKGEKIRFYSWKHAINSISDINSW